MRQRMACRLGVLAMAVFWAGYAASAQSPCGFLMPVSDIEDAQFSFSYWHHDDGTTPGIDTSSGQIAASFDQLYDSPLFGYTMAFGTEVQLENLLAQSWLGTGSMSYRYYVSEELPLFVYAGARIDAATYQTQPGFEVRSGVGIGRLRDVTPLAKAQRIVNALLGDGQLTQALSNPGLLLIANTVARESAYDEFEDYVAAVAETLESAVGSALDSAAVLSIRDELEREDAGRYCGAIVQGGVGYELIDPYGGVQDVLYVLSGDVAHAPTADSQLRAQLSWSAASGDVFRDNTSSIDLSYAAELGNSNAVTASYAVKRVASAPLSTQIAQAASLEYALAMNRGDLVFSLALSKNSGDPRWTVDFSVSFALELL